MITLYNEINTLCFYRDIFENPVFKEFYELVKNLGQPEPKRLPAREHFYVLKSMIADFALEVKRPVAKTAWKNFIISLLTTDNLTTQALEKEGNFAFKNTLKNDLKVFSDLYTFDFTPLIQSFDPGDSNVFSKEIFTETSALSDALEKGDPEKIYEELVAYIRAHGLGFFADSKVYRVNKNYKEDQTSLLYPVKLREIKKLDELVGYERQKEKLIKNTEGFLAGVGALNTLLYGEMGTGKSTMVKSLIEVFKDSPLRFVELKKDELYLIPELYKIIERTNYPFIIFIDDLSFENHEQSYKDLKNALEGSFEEAPENSILYATSNKKSLITQSKSEREDAVNARELLEEKLSLLSRFGLTIPFTVPKQSDYLEIVRVLANRDGILVTEDLEKDALQWELRHLNRSGRTAEQFIQFLKTQ